MVLDDSARSRQQLSPDNIDRSPKSPLQVVPKKCSRTSAKRVEPRTRLQVGGRGLHDAETQIGRPKILIRLSNQLVSRTQASRNPPIIARRKRADGDKSNASRNTMKRYLWKEGKVCSSTIIYEHEVCMEDCQTLPSLPVSLVLQRGSLVSSIRQEKRSLYVLPDLASTSA
jgi:hypothetical protein